MTNVAVLMSTYNGEKYIREQIDSILSQINKTGYKLDLYIRDDGSNDETLKIIETFTSMNDNVHLVDSTENLGVKFSFLTLLKTVEADFYLFSDQDDIWLEDKVEVFLEKLNALDNDIPGLVYSELELIDQNGDLLGETMGEHNNWHNRKNENYFKNVFFSHRVTGASSAVNSAMSRLVTNTMDLVNSNDIIMHDALLARAAVVYDNILFIEAPVTRYRQHANNLVGAGLNRNLLAKLCTYIKIGKRHYVKVFNEIGLIENLVVITDIRKPKYDVYFNTYNNIIENNVLGIVKKMFLEHNTWNKLSITRRIIIFSYMKYIKKNVNIY